MTLIPVFTSIETSSSIGTSKIFVFTFYLNWLDFGTNQPVARYRNILYFCSANNEGGLKV